MNNHTIGVFLINCYSDLIEEKLAKTRLLEACERETGVRPNLNVFINPIPCVSDHKVEEKRLYVQPIS